MNTIHNIDRMLFFVINRLPHTAFLDSLALTVSGIGNTGWLMFVFGFFLFLREKKKDHGFVIMLLSAGIISWMVQLVLKQTVLRIRPHDIPGLVRVGSAPSDFSFPSGHATVAWALAVILAYKEPRLSWMWYLLAFLISLSRIYLGVHYPVDVIGGIVFGSCIGYGVQKLFQYIHT